MNKLCRPNAIVLTATKNMVITNRKFSKKGGLYILYLNINSLLPKINEIRFIAKQSKATLIGVSEYKLDLSVLNSEVDIENHGLIRMDSSRRGGRVACCIRKSLSYNHQSSLYPNTESKTNFGTRVILVTWQTMIYKVRW